MSFPLNVFIRVQHRLLEQLGEKCLHLATKHEELLKKEADYRRTPEYRMQYMYRDRVWEKLIDDARRVQDQLNQPCMHVCFRVGLSYALLYARVIRCLCNHLSVPQELGMKILEYVLTE